MDIDEYVSVENFTSTILIEITDSTGNKLRFVKAERYLSKNKSVDVREIYILTDNYGRKGRNYLFNNGWSWDNCMYHYINDYIRSNLRSLLIKEHKYLRKQEINNNVDKLVIFSLLDYNNDIITIIMKIIIDLIPEKHYLTNF